MSAKLTPGVWAFHERRGSVEGESGTYGITAPAPHHWVLPPLNLNPEDVRVMAAAKDLLEALRELTLAWEELQSPDDGVAVDARAAIAKATGGAA